MIIFKKVPEKRLYSENQDTTEIEMKMSSDCSWHEVVDNLLDFLRGCGYVIPYGEVQIIEEEKQSDFVEQEKEPIIGCGPSFCFDCSCGKKEKALSLGEENS